MNFLDIVTWREKIRIGKEIYRANNVKPIPRVTDRGIQAVLEDLASSTAVPKDLDRPDYFRDNGPLEKLVASGWIEQLRK
jgi:hypothetical protein